MRKTGTRTFPFETLLVLDDDEVLEGAVGAAGVEGAVGTAGVGPGMAATAVAVFCSATSFSAFIVTGSSGLEILVEACDISGSLTLTA